MADVILRSARGADLAALTCMIQALAAYERLPATIVFTDAMVQEKLLQPHCRTQTMIAEVDGMPCGFALYYEGAATFFDIRWMTLEAIYVDPAVQRLGVGRRMMQQLAIIAQEHAYARMEWVVLGWNQAAIHFYQTLGAEPAAECRSYRLEGKALAALAETVPTPCSVS